ncbi:MurR/RpiR family transcriptional regulator [Azospirillum griseum]|uniref:MurR/RpiR family transcriptional regulator n=1 Tax=Azospirillum griseum TaxID=2496639 RepID=A0A3S0HXI4_9PROT|nr:MurR/RpiR family transcriptional regulator [Azospirillum griseum]RTR20226.1 MurR/RpiR family transcriptional regulator [Azospirillum griseum]
MTDQKNSTLPDQALTTRIHARYADLSRSEKRLADVILACPGEVSGYTATELAQNAGVSKMTVSRLVRRLGYANFDEARRAARRGTEWGSPLHLLDQTAAADGNGSVPPTVEAHFQRSLDSVAATARLIDPDALRSAARLLHGARRVWVCGARNSAFLAGYARWQFIQVRPEVHHMVAAGETLAETFADLDDRDVLLLVGIRRRTPGIIELLRATQTRGIPTILLTDSHSPLEGPAPPLTFRCETRSLAALDNHVAVMAVIHALTAELIQLCGQAGRERIKTIEALHESLGEF